MCVCMCVLLHISNSLLTSGYKSPGRSMEPVQLFTLGLQQLSGTLLLRDSLNQRVYLQSE